MEHHDFISVIPAAVNEIFREKKCINDCFGGWGKLPCS